MGSEIPPATVPARPVSPSLSALRGDLEPLVLRALVTSKDAGAIIGRGGTRIAELRTQAGVEAGISKAVIGVQERVMTVTGNLEGVCRVSRTCVDFYSQAY